MTVSEAQKRASKKYLDKLTEIKLRMTAEEKETIKAAADQCGESVNVFIKKAIEMRLNQGDYPI